MKILNIGGNDYEVIASPITLYFYKKEFDKDLIGELVAFDGMDDDPSKFDGLAILQMAWAMIKTARLGRFMSFYEWLSKLEFIDYEEEDVFIEIIGMVRRAFFRGGKAAQGEEPTSEQ